MNHPDYDFMLTEARRRDDLARAEQHRLFLAAKAAQRQIPVTGAARPERRRLISLPRFNISMRPLVLILARGLSFLGDHLLTWSCRLQGRYEVASGAVNEAAPCQ